MLAGVVELLGISEILFIKTGVSYIFVLCPVYIKLKSICVHTLLMKQLPILHRISCLYMLQTGESHTQTRTSMWHIFFQLKLPSYTPCPVYCNCEVMFHYIIQPPSVDSTLLVMFHDDMLLEWLEHLS